MTTINIDQLSDVARETVAVALQDELDGLVGRANELRRAIAELNPGAVLKRGGPKRSNGEPRITKPAKAKKASAGKPTRLPSAAVHELAAEVLAFLRDDTGSPQSCSAIAEALSLPTTHISQALAHLVKQGQATKRGDKRASVYLVEESPNQHWPLPAEPAEQGRQEA